MCMATTRRRMLLWSTLEELFSHGRRRLYSHSYVNFLCRATASRDPHVAYLFSFFLSPSMASLQEQQDMTELQSAVDSTAYSPIQPATKDTTNTHDDDPNDATNTDHDHDAEESKIPLDIVRLTLLMVSGKRHTYDFPPSTSILDVKKHVMEGWPQGKGCAWMYPCNQP